MSVRTPLALLRIDPVEGGELLQGVTVRRLPTPHDLPLPVLVADDQKVVGFVAPHLADGDAQVVRGAGDGHVDVEDVHGRGHGGRECPLPRGRDEDDETEEDAEAGEEPLPDGDLLQHGSHVSA
jgi:hypothetical protein